MIGVYAGRFDPLTNGHLDVIQRSARIFEHLIVAVYDLPDDRTLFSTAERVDLATRSIDPTLPVSTKAFSGLLPNFVRSEGAHAIVRGLRAVTDFSVEFDQALMYKDMAHDIEQIYLMSDLRHIFLSASRIREVSALGHDVAHLVPPAVAAALAQRNSKP